MFLLALGAISQAQMTLQGTVNVFVLDETGGAVQGAKLAPQNPAPCLLLATAYRKRPNRASAGEAGHGREIK